MVKVAVISDIHGNYIALEELLKDAKESGVTKYIFTGDLINEFPFGNKVINQIKELQKNYDVYVVKGNREQYLIEYDEYKYTWENVQFKNTVFMRNELTDDNFEFIKELPFVLSIRIEDLTFKIFHGSIYSLSEFIHNYDEDLMEKIANESEENILLFGHSHQRIWTKEAYGKMFINAGCSGVSKMNPKHSEYVILEIDKDNINIIDKNIEFDTERLKKEILESGILNEEKVFVNFAYLAVTGGGDLTREFFKRATEEMNKKKASMVKEDAKGIYKEFRLIDDDIWIALADEYRKYFKLED